MPPPSPFMLCTGSGDCFIERSHKRERSECPECISTTEKEEGEKRLVDHGMQAAT